MITTYALLSLTLAHDILPEPIEHAAALEQKAFLTLAAWGGVNTLAGGLGYLTAEDETQRAFHTMNAGWGAINLGLALSGQFTSSRRDSQNDQTERWLRMPAIFAFNAGLDVAYISAGTWLWREGKATGDPQKQGWGQSIVLQGSALLLFDAWMAVRFNQANRSIWLQGSSNAVTFHLQF